MKSHILSFTYWRGDHVVRKLTQFSPRHCPTVTTMVCLGLILTNTACSTHTSDEKLEILLKAKQSEFCQLMQMLQFDSLNYLSLTEIGKESQLINLKQNPGGYERIINKERWSQYQDILKDLRVQGGVIVSNHYNYIYFKIDSESIWNGDSSKGLVHTFHKVGPILENLDRRPLPYSRTHTYFKAIKPNWYSCLSFG